MVLYLQTVLLKNAIGIAIGSMSSNMRKFYAKYEYVFNLKLAWKMTLVTLPVA